MQEYLNARDSDDIPKAWKQQRRHAVESTKRNSFNLCGTWAGVAVMHGSVQRLKRRGNNLETVTKADMGAIHQRFTNTNGY